MGKFKLYTEEQLEKIARLREEANKPKSKGFDTSKYNNEWSIFRNLKVTDRVTVTIDGVTLIGYVLKVDGDDHTISTPYGVMKNISRSNLRLRYFKDLSHIVIPEELKAITLGELQQELNGRRNGCNYNDEEYWPKSYLSKYSDDEIRAELRTRPNIRKKRCQRVVNKHSK